MNHLRNFLVAVTTIALLFFGDCKTIEPFITVPVLSTGAVTGITFSTAVLNGSISSDGGAAVTERGFYLGTTESPEASGTKIQVGSGSGDFNTPVTGLSASTRYDVKAYAVNSNGMAYGGLAVFSTAATVPTVMTSQATMITDSSAVVGGMVTSDGGSEVTERGVYYGDKDNPEAAGTKLAVGNGTGTFSVQLTGLVKGTTYYVKAYAVNVIGEVRGDLSSFSAVSPPPLPGFTDSRDGHHYTYVTIGTQAWMAENLSWLPEVSPSDSGSYVLPHYYVYGYEGSDTGEAKATDNYKQYGVLYNWPAAMNGHAASDAVPSGVQGVCPAGWHLPSAAELDVLENYLGGWYEVAGGKLKSAGTIEDRTGLWRYPNLGANNESRFSGNPGGRRSYSGDFEDQGYKGYWQATSRYTYVDDTLHIEALDLEYSGASSLHYIGTLEEGFSIRCVRD